MTKSHYWNRLHKTATDSKGLEFLYRKKYLTYTIFLLKTRQMCYTVSGDENEEIRDNH